MTHIRRWIRWRRTTLIDESIANPSLFSRGWERRGEPRGKGGEREIIGHSYQSEAGCSASLFLSLLFPSIRGVADRLTAIHFAARTYAHESRSHAGSRYWRGRFIQFLFIAIDLSHPLGSSINLLSLPFVSWLEIIAQELVRYKNYHSVDRIDKFVRFAKVR